MEGAETVRTKNWCTQSLRFVLLSVFQLKLALFLGEKHRFAIFSSFRIANRTFHHGRRSLVFAEEARGKGVEKRHLLPVCRVDAVHRDFAQLLLLQCPLSPAFDPRQRVRV